MNELTWQVLERERGRRYVTFSELFPMVRAAFVFADPTLAEDLDEGDPDKELAYVGTALVQAHFARWGWMPPPTYVWTVN